MIQCYGLLVGLSIFIIDLMKDSFETGRTTLGNSYKLNDSSLTGWENIGNWLGHLPIMRDQNYLFSQGNCWEFSRRKSLWSYNESSLA